MASKRVKTDIVIQYQEKDINTSFYVDTAKEIWKNDYGRKMNELDTMTLYIKPEERTVYYVMNEETGSFEM